MLIRKLSLLILILIALKSQGQLSFGNFRSSELEAPEKPREVISEFIFEGKCRLNSDLMGSAKQAYSGMKQALQFLAQAKSECPELKSDYDSLSTLIGDYTKSVDENSDSESGSGFIFGGTNQELVGYIEVNCFNYKEVYQLEYEKELRQISAGLASLDVTSSSGFVISHRGDTSYSACYDLLDQMEQQACAQKTLENKLINKINECRYHTDYRRQNRIESLYISTIKSVSEGVERLIQTSMSECRNKNQVTAGVLEAALQMSSSLLFLQGSVTAADMVLAGILKSIGPLLRRSSPQSMVSQLQRRENFNNLACLFIQSQKEVLQCSSYVRQLPQKPPPPVSSSQPVAEYLFYKEDDRISIREMAVIFEKIQKSEIKDLLVVTEDDSIPQLALLNRRIYVPGAGTTRTGLEHLDDIATFLLNQVIPDSPEVYVAQALAIRIKAFLSAYQTAQRSYSAKALTQLVEVIQGVEREYNRQNQTEIHQAYPIDVLRMVDNYWRLRAIQLPKDEALQDLYREITDASALEVLNFAQVTAYTMAMKTYNLSDPRKAKPENRRSDFIYVFNDLSRLLQPQVSDRLKSEFERISKSLTHSRSLFVRRDLLNKSTSSNEVRERPLSPEDRDRLLTQRNNFFSEMIPYLTLCTEVAGAFYYSETDSKIPQHRQILLRPKEYVQYCAPIICEKSGVDLLKAESGFDLSSSYEAHQCRINSGLKSIFDSLHRNLLNLGEICGEPIVHRFFPQNQKVTKLSSTLNPSKPGVKPAQPPPTISDSAISGNMGFHGQEVVLTAPPPIKVEVPGDAKPGLHVLIYKTYPTSSDSPGKVQERPLERAQTALRIVRTTLGNSNTGFTPSIRSGRGQVSQHLILKTGDEISLLNLVAKCFQTFPGAQPLCRVVALSDLP